MYCVIYMPLLKGLGGDLSKVRKVRREDGAAAFSREHSALSSGTSIKLGLGLLFQTIRARGQTVLSASILVPNVSMVCLGRSSGIVRRRVPASRPPTMGASGAGTAPGADRQGGKLAPGGPHSAVPHRPTGRRRPSAAERRPAISPLVCLLPY